MQNPFWSNISKEEKKDEKNINKVLKNISIFEGLKEKELKKVSAICYDRGYEVNEVIFNEGEPGVGMYIIKSGEVKIVRNTEKGEKELARLTAGDFFGEIALLDESPRSATAIATKGSFVIGIYRPDLLDLINRNPFIGSQILLKLARLIGARLRQADERLKEVL